MKRDRTREKTLYSIVERNARVVPGRLAVHWGDERVTWRGFHENVNRAANFMLASGVRRGDNVGVMLRNSNRFVEAFIAAPAVGARPFNVNYRYKDEELRYVLDNAGAVMLFVNPEYEAMVESVRPALPDLKQVVVCGQSAYGNLEWSRDVAPCPPERPSPAWGLGTNDGEILFYTGGTTGMPKGVRWPQENVLAMIANNVSNALVKNLNLLADAPPPGPRNLLDMLGLPFRGFAPARGLYLSALRSRRLMDAAGDFVEANVFTPGGRDGLLRFTGATFRLLVGSPFMHGAAWIAAMPAVAAAGTLYLLPDSPAFDADAFWRLVESERIRIVEIVGDAFAVPLLAALEAGDYDLECLAVIGSGAVKLSPVMKEGFHERLPNAIIVDSLLATEGGGAVSQVSGARSSSRPHTFRIDSNGRFPVMVIDEGGCFVEPGSPVTGRLAYGGPQSTGYWNDPEKTAESYVEIGGRTWVMLGDLCRVEPDGSIEFIGREQTCINSGGEKIFPYELEDMLLAHPAVQDLVVVGVPHERWGEAVAAVIELAGGWDGTDDTACELRAFAREKISDFKVPKHWVFVESVGRTASGKVPYGSVRAAAMERLGIDESGRPVAGAVRATLESASAGCETGGFEMGYEFLTLEVEDGLGVVTINRAPANGISLELSDELMRMVEQLEEDDAVRCVAFKSPFPKYFMVGADLKNIPPEVDMASVDFSLPPEKLMAELFSRLAPHISAMLQRAQDTMNAVEALGKPTIAVIGGHAFGGGLEFALACDFRLMARGRARIGLTETTIGLIPAGGGTQRLPAAVGTARARELILSGRRLDADEAASIGLVTRAVDEDRLDEEALELGRSLARGATQAMALAKKILVGNRELSLEEGLSLERQYISALMDTNDMLEGVMAFMQGREPAYTGR